MKIKNILTIIISVIFVLATALVCMLIFTVEKINVTCDFSNKEENYIEEINQVTNKRVGGNLIFLNTQEIVDEIERNPYLYVDSIEKSFPNKVNLVVKDRKDVYLFSHDGEQYFLDENGLVLSKVNKQYQEREIITLKLAGEIVVTDLSVGNYLKINEQDRLDLAISLAKNVGLTDCVKAMSVNMVGTTNVNETGYDTKVIFETYTDVKITIEKAEVLGEEKADKAFSAYESAADYIKSSNTIHAYYNEVEDKVEIKWGREIN